MGRVDRLYTPPGWPPQVRPPGAPAWERTAVAWLLDVCPPEYRSYAVLRNHEVVLARFALLHVEGQQAAVRRGLSETRGVLRGIAEPAWWFEGAGDPPHSSLRQVLLHVIVETATHAGHLDVCRELVDGGQRLVLDEPPTRS